MERLLLGTEAFQFLEKEGFPVLKTVLAKDENEAAAKASQIGYPVALKISSSDVVHKTETGGIKVSLKNESEVREAFRDIVRTFTADNPNKKIDGVMVQQQGKGLELIVGTMTDKQFGPVIMFGLGGIFVEALNDVSFRLIPLESRDAREIMEDLQGYKILKNPRSEKIDLSSVQNFILQVSRLVEKHPEIREMDMNPVFASSKGIEVCDVRIKIG
ncbi:MAG: acetate--CoA ligase family protein [Spirochaetota bacterium]